MDAQPASDVAVATHGLGKVYRIYSQPQDRLKHMLTRRGARESGREFWALRDVSFTVRRGESVGIVGRNGSGKSTLLQILAGTLTPSAGVCEVGGKVAALLELGSGFNPQFTGRENVFLNGAILGLTRQEMESRFDEISAFADIGDFIDQPVRVYSSGMFVRLAFAVQALLPKDILIVDEALAVGDEAFQRKCFSAMERFRDAGGTVLLVSHNTQAIVRHCERCLLLSHGELVADDDAKLVTDLYQKLMFSPPDEVQTLLVQLRADGLRTALLSNAQSGAETPRARAPMESAPPSTTVDWYDVNMPPPDEAEYGNGDAEIVEVAIVNADGHKVNVVTAGQRYKWVFRVRFNRPQTRLSYGMVLKTVDGVVLSALASRFMGHTLDSASPGGEVKATFEFVMNAAPGAYFLNAGVSSYATGEQVLLHRRVDAYMVRVLAPDRRPYTGVAYLAPVFRAELIGAADVPAPAATPD